MNRDGKYPKVAFYAAVAIALIVIAFFAFNPKQDTQKDLSLNKSPVVSSPSDSQAPANIQTDNTQKQSISDNKSTNSTDVNKSNPNTTNVNDAIKIIKSEVSSTARFYPYNLDGTNMEIIAVKATDGTIRTALNTCQVCFDSGRGYYKQVGDYLVCQNCGNRFHIDQIEKIKGGCNPVPILETDKKDMGNYIALSKDFIATQKQYFTNWKKS